MAGVRAIILLAFLAAAGITLLVVGCVVYSSYYAFFVLLFYFLCPIPSLVARRTELDSASSLLNEICLFLTAAIVTSAYGLPILLAHVTYGNSRVQWPAAGFAIAGNTVVFSTIFGFFKLFAGDDDFSYSSW